MSYLNEKNKDLVSFFEIKVGALTSKPFAFTARAWELENLASHDFFDSLGSCIFVCLRGTRVLRVLPRVSLEINGEWISDKIRFSYDGWVCQRNAEPLYFINKERYLSVSWSDSFFYFFFRFNLGFFDFNEQLSLDSFVGKFIDLETSLTFRDFSRSLPNVLLNIKYSSYFPKSDNFNRKNYSFLENFSFLKTLNSCILVGLDLRIEIPLFYLKIMERIREDSNFFFFFLGINLSFLTVSAKNIFSVGNNMFELLNFLDGRGLAARLVNKGTFSVFLGESLFERKDGFQLLNLFNTLSLSNFFIKTRFSSISSRDLGLSLKRDSLLSFKVKLNFLYLLGSDEVFVKKNYYDFIIYQGHHGDYGAAYSDLCLPGCTVLEKVSSSLSLNLDLIKLPFISTPPGEARVDWRILRALGYSMNLNYRIEYNNLFGLFQRIIQLSPGILTKNIFLEKNSNVDNKVLNKKAMFIFSNTLALCTFGNYFVNDIFCRASKTMALSARNRKVYFSNFK